MNTFFRYLSFTLIFIFCIAASFAAGYLVHQHTSGALPGHPILVQAETLVRDNGLNPAPADPALEYGMIRGMLQAYGDEHTIFVEPNQHELETDQLEGKFGGIGVRLGRDANNNHILYPFPGGPASRAGLLDGDQLITVDDLSITRDNTPETIQAALRGPVGTKVQVTVQRGPNIESQTYQIEREEIALPSVTWHLDASDPRLGVVEINLIAASTPQEVKKAVTDLRNRGAVAYVLDLRDNFGGLLSAGVDTARLFLDTGVIMQQQYRGEDVETYRVEKPGQFSELPLAVLINENTASASEIIAGALQANKRAKLIGSSSYGKDTIQLIYDLQDGSSLHLTAARWWIPGYDQSLSERSLQPDILISPPSPDSTVDQAIQAAIQLLLGSG